MNRELVRLIAGKLLTCKLEYQAKISREEILILATDWAEELKIENHESVKRAFDEYRRTKTSFPCLAALIKILPDVRTHGEHSIHSCCVELPEQIPAPANEWASKVRDIRAALRGDEEARKRLEALTRTACGGVMQ
jgi:hypothetical protein